MTHPEGFPQQQAEPAAGGFEDAGFDDFDAPFDDGDDAGAERFDPSAHDAALAAIAGVVREAVHGPQPELQPPVPGIAEPDLEQAHNSLLEHYPDLEIEAVEVEVMQALQQFVAQRGGDPGLARHPRLIADMYRHLYPDRAAARDEGALAQEIVEVGRGPRSEGSSFWGWTP